MTSIPIPKNPLPNPYNHRIAWTPLTGHIDIDIKGHIILNEKNKKYKIMIFEWFNGDIGGYFRGENNKYPTFKTSYQKLENNFEKCIAWLQKREFISWFIQTPYYQYFAYGSEFAPYPNTPEGEGYRFCFDFEAIAQHYEFATNYLDITTKRDVAEFFAYTHNVNGKLVPIENFDNIQPCLYTSLNDSLLNPYNKDIRIVGFQALPRPINQHAMAINLENCKTDYKKEMFCAELPRDKKKAFEIFDKMEGGKCLFPDDWASRAASMIKDKYKYERLINVNALQDYCKEMNCNPKDILKRLKNKGYQLSSDNLQISKEANSLMQKDIDENIIPWINEFVEYTPKYKN